MNRSAPTLATMLASFRAQPATQERAPQWARLFRERGVAGTFVLHEPGPNRTTVC